MASQVWAADCPQLRNTLYLQVRQIPWVLTSIFVKGNWRQKRTKSEHSQRKQSSLQGQEALRGTEGKPGVPHRTPVDPHLSCSFCTAQWLPQQTALPGTWLESGPAKAASPGPGSGLCPLNQWPCSRLSPGHWALIHGLCGTYGFFTRWLRKHLAGRRNVNSQIPARYIVTEDSA